MNIASIKPKLFDIIEPVASDSGLEVVDISLAREGNGWVLRVYLDREGNSVDGVMLTDCERISRELSAVLDVADPIPCAYSLEVSSAGIDRPLRTSAHFERFRGQTAKVRLSNGIDGRRNFSGVIVEVTHEAVELNVDGALTRLPLDDLAAAKLVPDWDSLLGGGKLAGGKLGGRKNAPSSNDSPRPDSSKRGR